jgi:hypothetical protein
MNGDIGFGIDKGLRVVNLFLRNFRLRESLLLVQLLKVASEVAFNGPEFLGVDLFQLFVQGLNLGFVLEVLQVYFVVAYNLVELLPDHQLLNVDSLETRDHLHHRVADFEELLEVREQLCGFGSINQFELDHFGLDEFNGGFDVLVVVELCFEPFVQHVHAVLGVFLLFEQVLGLR